MDTVKCDICGNEIKPDELCVSESEPIRFCKKCSDGLSSGLLPVAANKMRGGLYPVSMERAQDGLCRDNPTADTGLYPPDDGRFDGLYEPEEGK